MIDTDGQWTAVILAGGRGRRMGEVEKSTVLLHGRSLLDHLLAGLPPELPVIVVGPAVATSRAVSFVLEEPRYGGPVAGLAAALPMVSTPYLALIATDMPEAAMVLSELFTAMTDDDDVVSPLDGQGRRQQLCSLLRTESVRSRLAEAGAVQGMPMHSFLAGLHVHELALPDRLSARLRDIDTPEDLNALQDPDQGTTG